LAVPITLPYEFDTTREGTLVVKIMLGLGFIVAVGIVYSLAFSRSWAAVLQLSLTGAVLLFFIHRFVNNLTGSIGAITANEIVVKRRNVYGLKFSGPAGVFSLHQFSAIRVEESSGSPSPEVQSGPHERIYLVGKNGTPDILIARTSRANGEYGIDTGEELGRLLNLPCERKRVPY
jgi:hypothetical protein